MDKTKVPIELKPYNAMSILAFCREFLINRKIITNPMRNPNKNTVKKLMREAKMNQDIGYYFAPWLINSNTIEARKAYYFFNNIGARLYIMSKGKICNRGLNGICKYSKHV